MRLEGSCWTLGQAPTPGSNTLVAGQMQAAGYPSLCSDGAGSRCGTGTAPSAGEAWQAAGPQLARCLALQGAAAERQCTHAIQQCPALRGQGCHTGPCPRALEAAACPVLVLVWPGLGLLSSASSQGWESLAMGSSRLGEEELFLGRVGPADPTPPPLPGQAWAGPGGLTSAFCPGTAGHEQPRRGCVSLEGPHVPVPSGGDTAAQQLQ